jgi:hypothetical protein
MINILNTYFWNVSAVPVVRTQKISACKGTVYSVPGVEQATWFPRAKTTETETKSRHCGAASHATNL